MPQALTGSLHIKATAATNSLPFSHPHNDHPLRPNIRLAPAADATNRPVSATAASPQCSPRTAPAEVPENTAIQIGKWQGQLTTASAASR